MNKKLAISLLVVLLLLAVAGVAYAAWQDTKGAQAIGHILPSPEGTFQITYANCSETVVGFEGNCQVGLLNESPDIMTIDAFTATTSYPNVTIYPKSSYVGVTVEPGKTYQLYFYFLPEPIAVPGAVVFDFVVTCSGPPEATITYTGD